MAKKYNDAVNAINAIFRTIPGIKRVYDFAPDTTPVGPKDLACTIPVLMRATARAQAFSYIRKDYFPKFLLLVAPYNKKLENIDSQARPFVDDVLETFVAKVQLNDKENIDHFGGDDAMIEMVYAKINYAGTDYIGYEVFINPVIKKYIEQSS